MSIKKINFIPFVLLFFLNPWGAEATGIKVSPGQFDFKARTGSVIKGEMVVANPTDQVALYEVGLDSLRTQVFFSRRSFVLESSQQSRIAFEIKDLEKGQYSFNFSVIASPLSSSGDQVIAASAVKIPVNIDISGSRVMPWARIIYFLDAIFALLLILILAQVLPLKKGGLHQARL